MESLKRVFQREPLSKKEILAELKKTGEGDTRQGFCLNSNRWTLFMAMYGIPKTCPYRREQMLHCEKCGYFEKREPSNHYIKRLHELRWGTSE